jgi:predicted ribosome quality control (RQC) complex YloA/Tae2 family protein
MGRTLSRQEISVAVREIDCLLRGAYLQDVRQPTASDLYLEFRSPGRTDLLLISASHDFSRLHLTGGRPPNPVSPLAFQSLLRSRLLGERIISAGQVHGDRVVEIEFSAGLRLIAELTGRHSNIFLCHGDDRMIVAPIHQTASRRRALLPGNPYQPPFPRPEMPEGVFPSEPFACEGEETPALFNEYLDRIYAPLLEARELELAIERALGAIGTERKRLSRLVENVSRDLDASLRAPEYTRMGEALKHSLYLVKKGSTRVDLPEYGPDGVVQLHVELKPALSARENMDRYFRLARRLSDARARIQARRTQFENRLAGLEKVEAVVRSATGTVEVYRLLRSAALAGSRAGAGRAPVESERKRYREYFIKGAGRLLVGGNAEDNDTLSFRVARGNDLWFHVIGYPGAHVVARMARGEEPSQAVIHAGARLAASRSRAPEGERVEVAWTRQKYLRKPKGAKAGAVLVSHEKRLLVEVEKNVFSESLIDPED